MADEVQNTNITIAGVEDTGTQIKIRDQNKRTYSFFKTKKDGGETAAFSTFKNFKIGDDTEISFKDVPYKEGTIRNILLFKPATGEPQAAPMAARRNQRGGAADRPTQEYWERREAKRQNSIIFQVAFKAAVELQSAAIRAGKEVNRDDLYDTTLEFYDFIADQLEVEAQDKIDGQAEKPQAVIQRLEEGEDIAF